MCGIVAFLLLLFYFSLRIIFPFGKVCAVLKSDKFENITCNFFCRPIFLYF